MKIKVFIATALVFFGAETAKSEGRQPQAPKPHEQSNVVVSQFPTVDEMFRAMPSRALDDELSGEASVACVWDAEGRPKNCRVTGESPRGQGFGKAAVKLVERKVRVDVDATRALPVVPDEATFRFSWILNDVPERP
ncbi:energy transducer TonB [Asticcacaulis tiandongensis]|uniref:energy transducer TonB n=1 Tax=Asticcacaulis tiandongensis TaxID=2565365 RepID=UPI0015E87723|nr:energy transducer TonB [Asticcacaulis tiandongensis]